MNIAIILAGGTGSRTNQDLPKQFLCVDDKPIIIHTLEKFQNNQNIHQIIVVSLADWKTVVSAYANQFNITKLSKIVSSGATRFHSIYNGLKYIEEYAKVDDIVLIYDANRPLITDEIINDSIIKAQQFGCSVGVLPCYDSLYSTEDSSPNLYNALDRSKIFRGMGPETAKFIFALTLFNDYYSKNIFNYNLPDMMLQNGYTVATSLSSSKCFKITTSEDIDMFVALYQSKKYKWLK